MATTPAQPGLAFTDDDLDETFSPWTVPVLAILLITAGLVTGASLLWMTGAFLLTVAAVSGWFGRGVDAQDAGATTVAQLPGSAIDVVAVATADHDDHSDHGHEHPGHEVATPIGRALGEIACASSAEKSRPSRSALLTTSHPRRHVA